MAPKGLVVIDILLGLILLGTPALPQPQTKCYGRHFDRLDDAAWMIARGNEHPSPLYERRDADEAHCPLFDVARAALRGWEEARKLAPLGGAVELLGPVNASLAELDTWRASEAALEVEYADTAIRAAVAAAQDERAELELLLTHARDLAERLAGRGRRADFPRPFNQLAGELWLEVDRYEEAWRAFDRAIRTDAESLLAQVGLADTLMRLNRQDEACAAYRRVHGAEGALAEHLRTALGACQ